MMVRVIGLYWVLICFIFVIRVVLCLFSLVVWCSIWCSCDIDLFMFLWVCMIVVFLRLWLVGVVISMRLCVVMVWWVVVLCILLVRCLCWLMLFR